MRFKAFLESEILGNRSEAILVVFLINFNKEWKPLFFSWSFILSFRLFLFIPNDLSWLSIFPLIFCVSCTIIWKTFYFLRKVFSFILLPLSLLILGSIHRMVWLGQVVVSLMISHLQNGPLATNLFRLGCLEWVGMKEKSHIPTLNNCLFFSQPKPNVAIPNLKIKIWIWLRKGPEIHSFPVPLPQRLSRGNLHDYLLSLRHMRNFVTTMPYNFMTSAMLNVKTIRSQGKKTKLSWSFWLIFLDRISDCFLLQLKMFSTFFGLKWRFWWMYFSIGCR